MKNYNWNRVYTFVMSLKKAFITEHPTDKDIYNKKEYSNVVERWANEVVDSYYLNVIHFLQINNYGDLYLFKYKGYNVIFGEVDYEEFWDMYDGFYRYCRGVTIDIRNDELVLTAYDKFFNIEELEETSMSMVASKIKNAKTVEITDKLDGSLQMGRFYNGRVILSGSTSVNPEDSYRVANGLQFIDEHENYQKMFMENPELCFIFESIMPDDPHVVVYDYNKMKGLYLTGIRNINTGEIYNFDSIQDFIKKYGVMSTLQEFISFEDMILSRDNYKCSDKEGWVVNIDGWRVKVKCTDFMALHGLLSGLRKDSDRLGTSVLEAMKTGYLDDFISSLPERYKIEAYETLDTIKTFVNTQEQLVEEYVSLGKKLTDNTKDFMLWVDREVPKSLQGWTRNAYRGKSNDFLKGRKFQDIKKNVKG